MTSRVQKSNTGNQLAFEAGSSGNRPFRRGMRWGEGRPGHWVPLRRVGGLDGASPSRESRDLWTRIGGDTSSSRFGVLPPPDRGGTQLARTSLPPKAIRR